MLAQVQRALGIVRAELADAQTDKPVFLPWAGWSLSQAERAPTSISAL